MTRGRPRRFNPDIPGHIDQTKLPTGAYWNKRDRNWYTLRKIGGKAHRKRLAGERATLADLHRLLEEVASDGVLGSIEALHGKFSRSAAWKRLADATQRDYGACLRTLARLKTAAGPASRLVVDRINRPLAQRLVDTIAADRPAMANHVKRYLSRLVQWGMQRGHCRDDRPNPFKGLEAAKEVGNHKMPALDVFARTLAFARERGQRSPGAAGALPEYLWIVMLLAYRLRLRGAEVLDLNDANHRPEGIYVSRRKGSRENTTCWTQELEAAWAAAIMRRNRIWMQKSLPRPAAPEQRPVIVAAHGRRLKRSSLDNTWRRFMDMAVAEHVLDDSERYSLHGIKHRGITDTKGRQAKQDGAGHRSPSMTDRYDHEVILVKPTPGTL